MTELEEFLRKIAFKHRDNKTSQGIVIRSGKVYRINGKLIEVCAECPCPEYCTEGRCSQP